MSQPVSGDVSSSVLRAIEALLIELKDVRVQMNLFDPSKGVAHDIQMSVLSTRRINIASDVTDLIDRSGFDDQFKSVLRDRVAKQYIASLSGLNRFLKHKTELELKIFAGIEDDDDEDGLVFVAEPFDVDADDDERPYYTPIPCSDMPLAEDKTSDSDVLEFVDPIVQQIAVAKISEDYVVDDLDKFRVVHQVDSEQKSSSIGDVVDFSTLPTYAKHIRKDVMERGGQVIIRAVHGSRERIADCYINGEFKRHFVGKVEGDVLALAYRYLHSIMFGNLARPTVTREDPKRHHCEVCMFYVLSEGHELRCRPAPVVDVGLKDDAYLGDRLLGLHWGYYCESMIDRGHLLKYSGQTYNSAGMLVPNVETASAHREFIMKHAYKLKAKYHLDDYNSDHSWSTAFEAEYYREENFRGLVWTVRFVGLDSVWMDRQVLEYVVHERYRGKPI